MATIFGSELSSLEKQAELMYMESTIELSKINTIDNIINAQYERMIMECDLYALKEGASYDDYDRMILEATVDKNGKEMGIIRSIINAIGNTIAQIGEWIQKAVGANMERLNNVPEDATGTVSGETMEGMEAAINGVPKFLNSVKETLNGFMNAAKEHKNISVPVITAVAFATNFGLGVFFDNTPEAKKAKETQDATVKKHTIESQIREWSNITKQAEETTNLANKVLNMLTSVPRMVSDLAQKNEQDALAKKQEKAANKGTANNTQAQQEPSNAANTNNATTNENVNHLYGLSAYDGLFMETSSDAAVRNFNDAVSSVKTAIGNKDKNGAEKALSDARAIMNRGDVDSNDKTKWARTITNLRKQIKGISSDSTSNSVASSSSSKRTTNGKNIPIQNFDGTPYNNKTDDGLSRNNKKPSNFNTISGVAKVNMTADNAVESKTAQFSPQNVTYATLNTGSADEKTTSKSNSNPNPNAADPRITDGRPVKTRAEKRAERKEQKAKDRAAKKPKKPSNEPINNTNTQQSGNNSTSNSNETTDTIKLEWYDKAIAWIKAVLQILAMILPAAGKCATEIIASICEWVKSHVSKSNNNETTKDGENSGNSGEQNQNTEATAQGDQQQAQNTQAQTNESVDLFGISEDYNAMMERPSVESVQAFEEIIQNL